MFGGMDPSKMQGMMKKLGISQENIDASKVVIDKSDGSRIIIDNPQVLRVLMQGQESFQITGDVSSEDSVDSISVEDVSSVMEKTGKSREVVVKALEDSDGDLAEAILSLSDDN